MLALFPPSEGHDLQFIIGVRHPLDSVPRHMRGDAEIAMRRAEEFLDEYSKLIRTVAKIPEAKLFIFSFEKLVREPHVMVPLLCDKLGMDPNLVNKSRIVVKVGQPQADLRGDGHWGLHAKDSPEGKASETWSGAVEFHSGFLFEFLRNIKSWEGSSDVERRKWTRHVTPELEAKAAVWGYSILHGGKFKDGVKPSNFRGIPPNILVVSPGG